VVWELELGNYTWSSPVGIYGEDGRGYIFQADNDGCCYLIDGATGEVLSTFAMNAHVEASPVAFGDRVVMGTRDGIMLFRIG
jgi:outer membrane protein assembly factor BamB